MATRTLYATEIPQASAPWKQPEIELGDQVIVYKTMDCRKEQSFLATVVEIHAAHQWVVAQGAEIRKCYHRSCPFVGDGHMTNCGLWEEAPNLVRSKRIEVYLERALERIDRLEKILATVAPTIADKPETPANAPASGPPRLTDEEIAADKARREGEAKKMIEELVLKGISGAHALMKNAHKIASASGLQRSEVEKLIRETNETEIHRRGARS